MRVTNEQAQADISKYSYFSECLENVAPLFRKAYNYAKDLLDARQQRDELLEAIKVSAKWFGEYADIHEKKGNTEKAMINISKQSHLLDLISKLEATK